jgi:two-component system OmpR family response regulator
MARPEHAGGGLSVLVVEDNRDSASTLATLLRMVGHEVQLAGNGPDALASVHSQHPDAVLLDIGLPGMDGWEVARHIRSGGEGDRPLLVAITGYGAEEDRQRSREVGIDVHITKPADPRKLLDLLSVFQKAFRGKPPREGEG